ncbi:class 1 fructose-bisphosphatase [Arenibaculum pallidiluteum]|uniref:class 1 fructose-bisphosphatase n=1 Tax=Arenibaculum pallidiluteum TaxID=2812559 RepID=UPI001A95B88D|nr:class 1 fructose-bisphosphatase [Arenibaculum pallidiluteum]
MEPAQSLDFHLEGFAAGDPQRLALVRTVRALADASIVIRAAIAGRHPEGTDGSPSQRNLDGDVQKPLDLVADAAILQALRGAPVALYASEEQAGPVLLDPAAALAVAADPLDGSANLENEVSVGTIFSVLPCAGTEIPESTFLTPGSGQLAAGFVVYGPRTALVLTLGQGTRVFILDPDGVYRLTGAGRAVPDRTSEFAINASNYRHWDDCIRIYVDDCLKGEDGPRGRDFNMRWIASLVAEAYRILVRGGVFLYPADSRRGYGRGRLRLVYEANPVAMVMEQAGGMATDGNTRILDLQPLALHQRIPLVFGSAREVSRIRRYHLDPSCIGERAPLFGHRSLFRA